MFGIRLPIFLTMVAVAILLALGVSLLVVMSQNPHATPPIGPVY